MATTFDCSTLYPNKVWQTLSAEQQESVCASTVLHQMPKQTLVRWGPKADCQGLVSLLKGRMRAYALSDEGREITLFYVEPGEQCALTAACAINQITFDVFLEAEEDSEAAILRVDALQRLMDENAHLRCHALELLTQKFSAVMNVLQDLVFKSLDARLAEYLLEEAAREKSNSLQVTQSEMARSINSSREVVTRALRRLAKEGVIKTERGSVHILKPEVLRGIH